VTPADPLESRELTVDDLRRAVGTYLSIAYPNGSIPDRVAERLRWREGIGLRDLLAEPAFEKAGASESGTPIHALRLGNARYPHMKLQIQPWPNSLGYMLSVNTHDQLSGLPLKAPDAQQFEALQRENQRIKEAVEDAWDRQGLPTFLRYLRDYIAQGQIVPGPHAIDDSSG
jgi:hypothetical protein